jgi:demethylmenaquinone methyltransferase/2-methoxy-6-polyprenyl-1,4-benzoquinol methylase
MPPAFPQSRLSPGARKGEASGKEAGAWRKVYTPRLAHRAEVAMAVTPPPNPQEPENDTVDFGFERVKAEEKAARVAEVFRSVAPRYDLMNDLMSLGTHRLMKRLTVTLAGVRPGHRVLDLAGGTGDVAALLAERVGPTGQVVLADINEAMLIVGRDRMIDRGHLNVVPALADGEALPFEDNAFDAATIAFGLRNVTRKDQALRELHRVLRPGAPLLVLEFSKPRGALLEKAYDAFSSLWPTVGGALAGDRDAYRYLNESIRMHPPQETLAAMMEEAGFGAVRFHNLIGGIAAIHQGRAQ